MKVNVHRETPTIPPITDVEIHLSPNEACKLLGLFGRLSRANIKEIFNISSTSDPALIQQVEEMFDLTSGLYSKMNEGVRVSGN